MPAGLTAGISRSGAGGCSSVARRDGSANRGGRTDTQNAASVRPPLFALPPTLLGLLPARAIHSLACRVARRGGGLGGGDGYTRRLQHLSQRALAVIPGVPLPDLGIKLRLGHRAAIRHHPRLELARP